MAVWQSHVADVRAMAIQLRPEKVGLGSYTFLPYHRTGAAAACRTPFSTNAPARARVQVRVPLTDGVSRLDASTTVLLRGPGDVLGIDQRQIVRRYPAPGVADAEPSDLVHCELDLPDLPWMFTPTGPSDGHLPPWLRLVVVPTTPDLLSAPTRADLPSSASLDVGELPPPQEAWAWAHVQVLGAPDAPAPLTDRLAPANPGLNVARLMCPRRLEPDRPWTALLVPTFEAGRQAGLGLPDVVDDLRWSWGQDGAESVRLPVYSHWAFRTGPDGDFESLARRIAPVPPLLSTGRRLVDTARPGLGVTVSANPGAREVFGPLVNPSAMPSGEPIAVADGVWDAATTQQVRSRVEQPDTVAFDPDAHADPPVAPALYTGTHVVTGVTPEPGVEPAWLRQLNLDPAHRVAAGLGAAVARMDQEDLMASAWAQLPAVLEANDALRAAQFARYVGDRVHQRHLGRLDPGSLLAVTQRSHARTLVEPGSTTRAVVGASATPIAATSSALRRLARPDGPMHRHEGAIGGSARLLASDDRAKDWTRIYAAPDGVHRLGEAARAILVALGADEVLERAGVLAEPTVLDELAARGGDADLPDALPAQDAARRFVLAALVELLEAMPTVDELASLDRGDPPQLGVLQRAAALVGQAAEVSWLAESRWDVTLPKQVAERHRLAGDPAPTPGEVLVPDGLVLRDLLIPAWEVLTEAELVDGEPFDEAAGSAIRRLADLAAAEAEAMAGQLRQVYDDAFVPTADLREPVRERLSVGSLQLAALLAPRRTLGRRVRQRIPELGTHFPGWLDNDRFDPVMAAPRFTHAMYEALHRYDPEWLLPGVGRIDPHDMVTVLQTNQVFIEAFLLGLNHEFARELVWRGYPTDGRATSFRSFWTPQDELAAPVHRLGPGGLGTHMSGGASAKLVFLVRGQLVRRYPQLLAHAVRQVGAQTPLRYADPPAATLFQVQVGADLLLVGVDLDKETVEGSGDGPGPDGEFERVPPDGAWWLTLSEHVGEPRFGLDEEPGSGDQPPPPGPRKRDDLRWNDWPTVGSHLTTAIAPAVRPPGAGGQLTSAVVGWLLFQLPARAGYRVARLLSSIQREG